MNILVTGGSGFIGSNFIHYILEHNSNINIINFDNMTYAGLMDNNKEIQSNDRYKFIQGDITKYNQVKCLLAENTIGHIIHFAAESHVDNSIKNPEVFVKTNVLGTYNLLENARQYWMNGIGEYNKGFEDARFHHISTDEVYGQLGRDGFFKEDTPYAPNSPYSASKASSDMLVRSYFHTYGMNVVTTNCSNNFGPKQHEEELIPKIIRNAVSLQPIPIYGDGLNIRDWLYVEDHCVAIEKVFLNGEPGETYLIGGHNERTNLEIVNLICELLNELKPIRINNKRITKYQDLITFVEDRPGHDFRYAIDDNKFREEFGEITRNDFKTNLIKTIQYYIET